jgi:hypothetical protein
VAVPRAETSEVGRMWPTGGGWTASLGAGEGTGGRVGGAGDVERGSGDIEKGDIGHAGQAEVGLWGIRGCAAG